MDDSSIRSSGLANILIVIAAALVIGVAAASESHFVLAAAVAILLLGVPGLSFYLFTSANVFVAWVTPLSAALLISLPLSLWTMGAAEQRLRRAIESAVRQCLPAEVADCLASGPLSPAA